MLSGLHPALHIPPTQFAAACRSMARDRRAPSPRVPPKAMRDVVVAAPLIRPRPRLSALGRGVPNDSVGWAHRTPTDRRPGNMYRSSRWGAPRLRAAALSSLPACAPSPLAGRNLPLSFNATAARPRPNALTLIPPGFVLPIVALAPPRFSSARASLIQALSLPCGARFARPYANAFPLPCGLRPRHASPRAGSMSRPLGAWCFRSPRGQTVRIVRFAHFTSAMSARLGTTGRGHTMPKKRTHVRPLLFSDDYAVTISDVLPRCPATYCV